MPGLKLQVTTAGRAALVNAKNTGTNAVLVSAVGVSTQPFTVSAALTALPNEVKRLAAVGGSVTAADTIHVSVRDESTAAYDCYGFGLYLSDGTLFAAYSQTDLLIGKAGSAIMLLAMDVVFADIDATQLVFGEASFSNPSATTEVQGIVELATDDEANAGTDKVRALTAANLKKVLDNRLGAGAPSEFVKGLLGKATIALFRTALELKSAALKDTGAGNGLDADLLDGQEGAWYRSYNNLTDVPKTFVPAAHTHVIDDVTGLADAIAAKFNAAGGTISGQVTFAPAGTLGLDVGAEIVPTIVKVKTSTANVDYLETLARRVTSGDSWNTATLRMRRRVDGSSQAYMDFGGSSTPSLFAWGVGATELMTLSTSGGFATPFCSFGEASAAIYSNFVNFSGGSTAYSYHYNTSPHWAFIKRSGSYNFYWRVNDIGAVGGANEKTLMQLTDSGALSIAGEASAASWKLSATQGMFYTAGSTAGDIGVRVGPTGGTAKYFTFYGDGTFAALNGAIKASGGFQPTSSIRVKTAFRENPYGLAAVLRLTTTLGKFRKWFNPDGRERVFHIAENIAAVMPQVAAGSEMDVCQPGKRPERVPGYAIEQLQAVHTRAIQELHALLIDEVAALREEIHALKSTTTEVTP